MVLSGKGGVGKSTVSSQLAFSLASQGFQVGILDIDICGPSIPRMMGVLHGEVHQSNSGWDPVYVDDNLSVMSIGFLLGDPDDAVIWRGAKKHALIQQFLSEINWGELDYLIIDTPPGTSDEHISIVNFLRDVGIDGGVIVTTPQEVSLSDVRKEIRFCQRSGIRIIGIIENMSEVDFHMTECRYKDYFGNDITDAVTSRLNEVFPELANFIGSICIFPPSNNGGEGLAQWANVPFLGRIPIFTSLEKASEMGEGAPAIGGRVFVVVSKIVNAIVSLVNQ